MSELQWYHRAVDGSIALIDRGVEFAGSEDEGTDGMVTNAEEGSVGRSRIKVNDPTSSFEIAGHRKVYAVEAAAVADDYAGVIGVWYTGKRQVQEGEPFDGIGRVWMIDLDDLNTVLDRRIVRDADSDRPDETDIERLDYLLGLGEMGLIDDDTYVDRSSPVNLDGEDLQNKRIRDCLDSLAQMSGNNWFVINLKQTPDGFGDPNLFGLWYGKGEPDILVSEIRISNDIADTVEDPENTFYPKRPSTLDIDPTRVYSQAVVEYQGGSAFVTVPAIETRFALGHRDTSIPASDVKSAGKASARGLRQLNQNATEEETITVAIDVPAARVNCLVAGMRVPVKLTWAPGFVEFRDGRVVTRTVRPMAPGVYEISAEILMAPVVVVEPTETVFCILYQPQKGSGWDEVNFNSSGDDPAPGYPTAPTTGPVSKTAGSHWTYEGLQIDGTGQVDIEFIASCTHAVAGAVTDTFGVYLNGALIGSAAFPATGGIYFFAPEATINIPDVDVVPGDVITCKVTTTWGGGVLVPSGTGNLAYHLLVTGELVP